MPGGRTRDGAVWANAVRFGNEWIERQQWIEASSEHHIRVYVDPTVSVERPPSNDVRHQAPHAARPGCGSQRIGHVFRQVSIDLHFPAGMQLASACNVGS